MKSNLRPRRDLAKLEGQPCWYVASGGAAGSSFSLAIGGKERRDSPLKNKAHSKVFRNNSPQFALLVWCSWRVSKDGKVVVTSDDCANKDGSAALVRRLKGKKLLRIDCRDSFGDLRIDFADGYRLDIFCDHGRIAPTLDDNWELFAGDRRTGGA